MRGLEAEPEFDKSTGSAQVCEDCARTPETLPISSAPNHEKATNKMVARRKEINFKKFSQSGLH